MKKQRHQIIFSTWLVILGFTIFTFISVKSLSQQVPSVPSIPTPSITPSLIRPMPLTVDPTIPKQIHSCMVPKADQISLINKGEKIKTIELVNQVTGPQKQTFYYLEVKTVRNDLDSTNAFFYPLITLDSKGRCKTLHLEDEIAPLSYYIPLNLARQLELKIVKQEIIDAGGKDKYQQQLIDENISGEGVLLLSPERKWVLQQLGISVPPNSIIFNKPYSRSEGSPFP